MSCIKTFRQEYLYNLTKLRQFLQDIVGCLSKRYDHFGGMLHGARGMCLLSKTKLAGTGRRQVFHVDC